jgi:hypothetical protein
LPERGRLTVALLGAAHGELERLISRARQERSARRYADTLERLQKQSIEEYDRESSRVERAGEALVRRLGRMRPPAPVAPEHDALLTSLGRYLTALRDFHRAFRFFDTDVVARSIGPVESARADVEAALDTLHDRLAESGAWKVMSDSVAESQERLTS